MTPRAGDDFSFAEQVRPLRDAASDATRFVFATATLPEQVFMNLEEVGGLGARRGGGGGGGGGLLDAGWAGRRAVCRGRVGPSTD